MFVLKPRAVGSNPTLSANPIKGGFVKTISAYKLFETRMKYPGQLFPLFIDTQTAVRQGGVWVPAQFFPTKGYAERPGWHAGLLPMAPHLRCRDGFMAQSRVWAKVSLPAGVDWQPIADRSATKDLRGIIPKNGYYRFKTSKMQGGVWLIGGALRIEQVLSDTEVATILEAADEYEAALREQHYNFTHRIYCNGDYSPC